MQTFTQTMNELRAHHKSCLIDGKSPAPRSFTMPSGTELDEVTPEEKIALDELKSTAQVLATAQNQRTELTITQEAQNLTNAGSSPAAIAEFKQKMNERRALEKELSEKNIDRIFDKAIEIGERHPTAQKAIFSTTDLIFNLFRALSEKFNTFITKIVASVISWIENAFTDIKANFNNVSDWIKLWFAK